MFDSHLRHYVWTGKHDIDNDGSRATIQPDQFNPHFGKILPAHFLRGGHETTLSISHKPVGPIFLRYDCLTRLASLDPGKDTEDAVYLLDVGLIRYGFWFDKQHLGRRYPVGSKIDPEPAFTILPVESTGRTFAEFFQIVLRPRLPHVQ